MLRTCCLKQYIAMDNMWVYTDKQGKPAYVPEANDEDIGTVNGIQQIMMQLEEAGVDHETQRSILQGVYGKESAHFRAGRARSRPARENRAGAGQNAGGMGKGDYEKISSERSDNSFSLRKITTEDLTREYPATLNPSRHGHGG